MSSRPLAPGSRFGRYLIEDVCGRGTFGVVYGARHDDLPRTVALKVLHRELAANPEVVKRFRGEARAIAEFRHPHIVDVYDVGMHDGVPFLAMEYLEGETLRDRLERETLLPLDVAVDLLLPIFSAVSAVHRRGFVHRDVKPDNIVLSPSIHGRTHPKLLDFGVVKTSGQATTEAASLTRTGAAIGTPYYMSPEQAEEAKDVDAASDQWALAVTLYRAITGEYPFDGRSVVKILNAIVDSPAPLPSLVLPTCPAVVERALLRALAKSPTERFPSVRMFGAVLLPFASRRAREDWREEFVDTEARTVDLGAARPVSKRPPTQQGPAYVAPVAPPPPPSDDAAQQEPFFDDAETGVNILEQGPHDTIPVESPPFFAGASGRRAIAPIARVSPPMPVAVPPPPVAIPPPPVAVPAPSVTPIAPPPVAVPIPLAPFAETQGEGTDNLPEAGQAHEMSPREPSDDAHAPEREPAYGTLSLGAHSVNPLQESRRARRQVIAAGTTAALLVLACVVVMVNQRTGMWDALSFRSGAPPTRRISETTRTAVAPPTPTPVPLPAITTDEDAALVAVEVPLAPPPPTEEADPATPPSRTTSGHERRDRSPVRAPLRNAPDAAVEQVQDDAPAPPPAVETAPPETAEAELPERLTHNQASAVMRSVSRDVERCGAGHSGTVLVSITITAEGVPASVTVQDSSWGDELRGCVIERVRLLRFPPSRRAMSTVFPYPLHVERDQVPGPPKG